MTLHAPKGNGGVIEPHEIHSVCPFINPVQGSSHFEPSELWVLMSQSSPGESVITIFSDF